MDVMIIDVGLYTTIEVDLSEFDFDGVDRVILTVRNFGAIGKPIVFEKEYKEPKVHYETITPEESRLIEPGAKYDFNIVLTDGNRYAVRDSLGDVKLIRGCGQCQV